MHIKTESGGGVSPIISATVYLDDNNAVRYSFHRNGYADLKYRSYTHLTKEGNQRKWRSVVMWDAFDSRNNKISEPPFPSPEICNAVLQEYFKLIKVTA